MTPVALRHAWRCAVCDAHGTGTAIAVDKAAEKHVKTAKHAVLTWAEPNRKGDKA